MDPVRWMRLPDYNKWELVLLVAWVAFLLLVVIPWMVRHSQ